MSGVTRPIKWIGKRGYGGRFVMGRKDILPICIRAGALEDHVPRRDLWVSPNHAMYVDGVLIEVHDLLNGVSIMQAERVEQVEYFHIELDAHDVIVAEGALSESFLDDDTRAMFHNADEYRVHYPHAGQQPAQRFCAPRLYEGQAVETARRRFAERAGLPGNAPRAGMLRGYVDFVGPDRVSGWAYNSDFPQVPVCLGIFAAGRLLGHVLANRYRKDLEQAGIGSGCYGFEFIAPLEMASAFDAVEVRRSLDGEALNFTIEAGCAARQMKISAAA